MTVTNGRPRYLSLWEGTMYGYPFNTRYWRQLRWWGRQWQRLPDVGRQIIVGALGGALLALIVLRLAGW